MYNVHSANTMNTTPPNPLPETLPAGTRFRGVMPGPLFQTLEPAPLLRGFPTRFAGCWRAHARVLEGAGTYRVGDERKWIIGPEHVDWSTYRPEPASEPTTKPGPERRFCGCGQEAWQRNGAVPLGFDGAPMCSDCFSNERARALHGVMVEPIDARIRAAQPADEPVCAWSTATSDGVEWR